MFSVQRSVSEPPVFRPRPRTHRRRLRHRRRLSQLIPPLRRHPELRLAAGRLAGGSGLHGSLLDLKSARGYDNPPAAGDQI